MFEGDLPTRTSSLKLSPLSFNITNVSVQRHKQPTGCSLCTAVVNHLIYTDDLLPFAPPKDYKHYYTYGCYICYTYGCEHDVQYNAGKSLVMYFDCRNANLARETTLGGKKLNFATSYKYLGHVICNDLLDEADIQAKVWLLHC